MVKTHIGHKKKKKKKKQEEGPKHQNKPKMPISKKKKNDYCGYENLITA